MWQRNALKFATVFFGLILMLISVYIAVWDTVVYRALVGLEIYIIGPMETRILWIAGLLAATCTAFSGWHYLTKPFSLKIMRE